MKGKKKPEKQQKAKKEAVAPQEKCAPKAADGVSAAILPEGETLSLTKRERMEVILFYLAVTVAIFVPTGYVSMVLAALCLIFTVRKSSLEILREHFSVPLLGIVLMFLLYGASAVLQPATHAMKLEWYRGLCVFSLSGYALLRFRKKHVPALLWGVVAVMGVMAFVSLSGASKGILYYALAAVTDVLEAEMGEISQVSSGRLVGIFNNSNAAAGVWGMAALVGLHQLRMAEKKRERLFAAFFLGLNGIAFWLCLSRGALLAFGVALVAYLLFARKGSRLAVFMTMACAGFPILAFGLLAQNKLGVDSILPVVLALAVGPVIFLVNEVLAGAIVRVLEGRKKLIWVSAGMLSVMAVAVLVAALSITGPQMVQANGEFTRVVNLTPGESYTASIDCDGDPRFEIFIKTRESALMNYHIGVYDGTTKDVSFTVPEDAVVVYAQFESKELIEIRDVTFSDGTTVKLDYKLLPASIEGRLQDPLRYSVSFLLRMQYVKDALKIFASAPLFGRGLGSTDTWYTSVQPFFYQSQFVHNHLVQYLADLGIAGFVAFLMAAGGAAWLLLRRRKRESDGLSAVLLAVLVMMNLHSAMEINFSIRTYAVMAYLLITVMTILCEDSIPLGGKETVKKAATGLGAVYWSVMAIFGITSVVSQVVAHVAMSYTTTSFDNYMSALESYVALDVYDDAYYKVLYLADGTHSPQHAQKAEKYAQELWDLGQYTYCDSAARYYYLQAGRIEEMFACSRTGIEQKAADPESWNGQLDFYRATVMPALYQSDWLRWKDLFLEGVVAYRDALLEFNMGQMRDIELSEDNQAFLDLATQIYRDVEMDPETAYELLAQYSEAESEW